ncbi:MAG: hypothetical protein OHK0022_17560 [Roseiflexaceae bacterium]
MSQGEETATGDNAMSTSLCGAGVKKPMPRTRSVRGMGSAHWGKVLLGAHRGGDGDKVGSVEAQLQIDGVTNVEVAGQRNQHHIVTEQ